MTKDKSSIVLITGEAHGLHHQHHYHQVVRKAGSRPRHHRPHVQDAACENTIGWSVVEGGDELVPTA
eukprot:m.142351 g.142351  ORF g.142351 m.142351 type:complete len:67 (+) comp14054_c0_seq1:98-298(+)